MSSAFELQVTERDSTLNPRQLREAGFLPATVYGKGQPSLTIQVRTYEFERAVAQKNSVFKFVGAGLDGLEVKVQTIQTDIAQKLLNVEFLLLSSVSEKKPAAKQSAKAKKEAPEAALASA